MKSIESLKLLAEGREAEVFEHDETSVLKLLRPGIDSSVVHRERDVLELLTEGSDIAPKPKGIISVEERFGLILERVAGPDLLTLLGRKPWLVWSAGAIMGDVHSAINHRTAPPSLPRLKAVLQLQIAETNNLDDDLKLYALSLLDSLPDGESLCHGDFHLGNILGSFESPKVIDWAGAARGDPISDLARTEILHRIGDPPPGTSPVIRAISPVGRGILLSSYMRAYRRRIAVDTERFEKWRLVRAAARFSDGIEVEFPALAALVERHRHRRG